MILSSVIATAQICAELGVRQAIISPGSRNAPLTIAFVRHPTIETYTVSDERSAAFIGLGMARQTHNPVALICTSGSAAYNYAPAVAEAYFQQIPLLILTADRPPEWIDQLDGQTIRQRNIYGKHVKASYELPVGQAEADQWYAHRQVSEAINQTQRYPPGPVHVNIPIREPFYPEEGKEISFDDSVKVIQYHEGDMQLSLALQQQLQAEWQQYERKLIVVGQGNLDQNVCRQIAEYSEYQQVPVVADIISNFHLADSTVRHPDVFLGKNASGSLQPDLLLTFGLSVISKNLKLFLRKHRPQAHWHIQPSGVTADTFQSLTKVIYTRSTTFFQIAKDWLGKSPSDYYQAWQEQEEQATQKVTTFFESDETKASEFYAVVTVLKNLPQPSSLHLANSMAVRYANLISLPNDYTDVEVIANRGTSGIDGSSSTAVGAALASPNRLHILITGDLAFFYDRNAFWHNYLVPNLRIIVLNNHGGGIFRMIDGPSRQPELEEYFVTQQKLEAKNTASDFGLEYHRLDINQNEAHLELEQLLPGFFTDHRQHAKLLEIVSDSQTNTDIFRQFKSGD
ncbi:2-succinyl-5-enolpyruvyl-6-hydroxy-3-cyclohexene-1-carboxylic-acid synthase [Tunicatimonas pelagia]|uniref:2-succinyl-5-enolpyruvyl-6-hydroxy-3- cyclohexene-1-carboxylic-acid synthase n=1 Tax=Tunicatimonas pelagia TaxID=931531 RepID=UPI0026650574|nr:2-succinyl-5-enolpyruvyl-6-hydroxy-3-cyclohexene-1-carboxylic-acid synthase [Tunicatimonas pelagia]WKN44686.1 2-succinyl-5-enolpyruvyl-6-hydroxy-3-cyclohexene-1-carboxylic-acid synthase [Tunicatimonas pelagia]